MRVSNSTHRAKEQSVTCLPGGAVFHCYDPGTGWSRPRLKTERENLRLRCEGGHVAIETANSEEGPGEEMANARKRRAKQHGQ